MIQFFADQIDQLDLALDQLAVRDRNFDRFALMLIDNVVELTLHRRARDCASENEMWSFAKESKYEPKVVEEALGQRFDKKVKLGASIGLFSKQTQESLLNLHSFRNTAYHRGLRHETILHSLSLFYFRAACQVLGAYKPLVWSWGSSDVYSHRALKYLGKPHLGGKEQCQKAFQRLDEVAASMGGELVADLAADMGATIEDIDAALEFLANDSPEQMTRDDAVIHSQVWAIAFSDETKAFARDHGCEETTVGGYVDWLKKNHPWSLERDPIEGWRSRLEKLKTESDEHQAQEVL